MAHRCFVSLNSMLESNEEKKKEDLDEGIASKDVERTMTDNVSMLTYADRKRFYADRKTPYADRNRSSGSLAGSRDGGVFAYMIMVEKILKVSQNVGLPPRYSGKDLD